MMAVFFQVFFDRLRKLAIMLQHYMFGYYHKPAAFVRVYAHSIPPAYTEFLHHKFGMLVGVGPQQPKTSIL